MVWRVRDARVRIVHVVRIVDDRADVSLWTVGNRLRNVRTIIYKLVDLATGLECEWVVTATWLIG
jgi:hypothetical protein